MPLSEHYISQANDILEKLARDCSRPICYSQLSKQLGLAARAVGGVLQPISERSYAKHGILLSVLAVSKKYGLPSDNFFNQAKKLGAMPETVLPQMFFRDELRRVYDAYKQSNVP